MLIQILRALHQPLRVGKYRLDIRNFRVRHPEKRMLHRNNLLAHNIIIIFFQQVVAVIDNTRRGILDGQHCVIRHTLRNGVHGIPPPLHMEMVHILTEKCEHGLLGIGALHALVNHPDIFLLQLIHHNKGQASQRLLLHQLILQLPADTHDLLVQLFHPVTVKIIVGQRFNRLNLLIFPLLIQDLLSGGNLILRHLFGDTHALLKKRHHLPVNPVYFHSQLF